VEEVTEGIYEPVSGRTQADGTAARLQASLPGRGLELEARFQGGPECIRVDGLLRDTTGRDRAIGVSPRAALDLTGWTWYHDAEEREIIQPGAVCRRTYKCVSGVGQCSIYPWSAVSSPAAPRHGPPG